MTTTSTVGIENALRTRLLTFVGLSSGTSLAQIIGVTPNAAGVDGKLFWDQAPDNIDSVGGYPYGILALKNRRSNAENAERDLADLEVTLFGRDHRQVQTVQAAADACDEAMLRFVDASSGVMGCWGRLRSTMPVFEAPADREVVMVRSTYTLVLWPAYLTQYHDS